MRGKRGDHKLLQRERVFFILSLMILLTASPPAYATDTDGDGIDDAYDNCTFTANPDQLDANGNNIGDACEEYVELLSQATCCEGLSPFSSPDSAAQSCYDVTQLMEDGPPFLYSGNGCSIDKNRGSRMF